MESTKISLNSSKAFQNLVSGYLITSYTLLMNYVYGKFSKVLTVVNTCILCLSQMIFPNT